MQWTWEYRYLFELVFSLPSDKYPEMELLDCMAVLFLNFWGTSKQFLIVAVPIYIPTNSAQGFPFFHFLTLPTSCLFDNSHSNRCEAIVVLTCIFLMISDIKHLFMYLLATCMSSLKRYIFRDFPDGPVAKTPHSQCRGPGSIPGQGARSHMLQVRVCLPQLKIPPAATKTWRSQINK